MPIGGEYERRRRKLSRRADDAMDDLEYTKDSFRHALQPRGGCLIVSLASLSGSIALVEAARQLI